MTTDVVTDLSLLHFRPSLQGKVRDIFDLGETLLVVATDRLSAFDVVLPDAIPQKGKVLTQISAFWFRRLSSVVPHHLLSTDVKAFPPPFADAPGVFSGRSMLVKKARPLPVECVVRGYLSGSGWTEYRQGGSICGLRLPAGLRESDRLPEPLFTPSTKAGKGAHDENVTFDDVVRTVGGGVADALRDVSLRLYREGAAYAETRGIIIADTKFEFGVEEDRRLLWIDEALTPDSSRFWSAADYRPGGPQASFDKQFVRDYLLSLGWDKSPPGPRLPASVIATTSKKYEEALRLLTGQGVEEM